MRRRSVAAALVALVLASSTAFFSYTGAAAYGGKPVQGPGQTTPAPRTPVEVPVNNTKQVLVLMRKDSTPSHLERLQHQYKVISLLRPRVLVFDIDEQLAAQLRDDPEVVGVFTGEVPEEVLTQLDPGERLFVSAWQQRSADKKRRGDGLPWDAPGFVPPDLPPRK